MDPKTSTAEGRKRSTVTSGRVRRRLNMTALSAVVAAPLLALAAAPASAAAVWPDHQSHTHSDYSDSVNVRSCADTGCGVTAVLYNDSGVYMQCYADGGSATGNYTSSRWFWVYYGSGSGWVHSSLVDDQATVPPASDIYNC